MIEEWLGLGMVVGHTESLDEELLEQLEVRVPAKGFVKGEEGTGGAQTVPGHLQLSHGVNILHLAIQQQGLQ